MRLQSCENTMNWCTAQCKCCLCKCCFVWKVSRNFDLARRRRRFWQSGDFVVFFFFFNY